MGNVIEGVGAFLNDLTGVTNSSKNQWFYQMELQKSAQEFQKKAHQNEVADLQAAGLNPVLSAGGQGTSPVGMGGASTGTPAADPISMINAVISMINSTKKNNADVKKTEAETKNINANTSATEQTIQWTPALNNALIRLQNATSNKQQASAGKDLQDILESQARTQAQQIMNQMSGMDLTKRQKYFDTELEIKKQQMKAELVSAGFESSEVYQAIDRAFATAGKIFKGSVSYNYGYNSSYNNSNVNVRHNNGYGQSPIVAY